MILFSHLRYDSLRKSGGVILEGYALEEALLEQSKLFETSILNDCEDDDIDIAKMDPEKLEDYLKEQINVVEKEIKNEMLEKKFLEKEETVLKKFLHKNEKNIKILEKSNKNIKNSQDNSNRNIISKIEELSLSFTDLVAHINKSISYYDFELLNNKQLFFFQTNLNTFLLADEEITNIIKESYKTLIDRTNVENLNTFQQYTINELTDDNSINNKFKKDLKVELAFLENSLYKTDFNFVIQCSKDIGKKEKNHQNIKEDVLANNFNNEDLKNEILQINSKISSKELIEKTKIASIDSLIRAKVHLEVEIIAASNYEEILSIQKKIIQQFDNIINNLVSQSCFRSILKGLLWMELERVMSLNAILSCLSEHIGLNFTSLSSQKVFSFSYLY